MGPLFPPSKLVTKPASVKKVEEIVPFPRCWVPRGFTLAGFVTSLDGGKSGYGAIIHAIAIRTREENEKEASSDCATLNGDLGENEVDEKLETSHPSTNKPTEGEPEEDLCRSIAITRSKICKRNVVSHEVSAGKLGLFV